MSAYTTLYITGTKAKAFVLQTIFERINDDKFLEELLDFLLENRLYNAYIVNDSEENNDDYIL